MISGYVYIGTSTWHANESVVSECVCANNYPGYKKGCNRLNASVVTFRKADINPKLHSIKRGAMGMV